MKSFPAGIVILIILVIFFSCRQRDEIQLVRQPVDTIGFAQYRWQVDSILSRIERYQPRLLSEALSVFEDGTSLRVAISPHDDYAYVGYLYPALFRNVRSQVVILFGVGHKAREFGLEDRIVFGSYGLWRSPGGTVKVSELQGPLMKRLPSDMYTVHDSLQAAEHSIEAMVPFLEYYNSKTEIIPIIVPFMSFGRMEEISSALSEAITVTMNEAGLPWGSGWSIVISTDAVHYGSEEWGGRVYDRFGVDSAGYEKAVEYEKEIMTSMLAGELTPDKIKEFSRCTVKDSDYHEYLWTWCGRYSVPLGLLTAYDLSVVTDMPLTGIPAGYSTSIACAPLPVSDIGMGVTAPAKLTHWVGYAAVGYK